MSGIRASRELLHHLLILIGIIMLFLSSFTSGDRAQVLCLKGIGFILAGGFSLVHLSLQNLKEKL